MPPEFWANAEVGKYYRPVKTRISFRVDNDVLDWLKSESSPENRGSCVSW